MAKQLVPVGIQTN